MATLEGHVKANPFQQSSLDGITDPKEFYATYHKGIRESLQAGGLVPPTGGITKSVTDAQDTGSFFKDLTNKITSYAGVKAFNTKGDSYEENRFKFIAAEEGYRTNVYKDSVGRRTIGYGFNLDDPGNKRMAKAALGIDDATYEAMLNGTRAVTQRESRTLFEAAASSAESVVSSKFGNLPMNAHQRIALVSMAYNHPSLIGPKLTKAMQSGDATGVLNEIRTNSNRFNIKGIQSRREREARMFAGYGDEKAIDLAGMFGIKSAQAATPGIGGDTPGVLEGWAKHYSENPAETLTAINDNTNTLSQDGQVIKRADGSVLQARDGVLGSHVKMLVNDLFANTVKKIAGGHDILDWNNTTYDSSFFRKQELEAMLNVVGRSYIRGGGKNSGAVTYTDPKGKKNDYAKGTADVAWKSDSLNVSGDDAENVVKTTLGQFNWHLNKQGELIVEDKYNFNDAQKYREMYPEASDRAMHMASLIKQASTGGETGWYGVVRRFAALYGSAEGEGANFKINLGKVDMKRLAVSAKTKDRQMLATTQNQTRS